MNDNIVTKVVLEVDNSKLNDQFNRGINNAANSSKGSAANSGKVLGATMGNALGSVFSAITTAAVLTFANNAVKAFQQVQIAQSALTGSVQSYANRQQRAKEIVSDTTKSYEEKAIAIGFNTDKIYEETKASQGASISADNLSRTIQLQERAFEDTSRAVEQSIKIKQREADQINKQIALLRKETDQRIALRRQQLGGDVLDSELKTLEISKDSLEVQKAEAELAGDPILAFTISNQISQLQKEINLREKKLDVIRNETDAIKDQATIQEQSLQKQSDSIKAQVESLRNELDSSKNKFDIDVEPAKRKLEDLRASVTGSSGTTKSLSKGFEDAVNKTINSPVVDTKDLQEKTRKAIDNVYQTIGKQTGTNRATLEKAASQLQIGGLINADEIENTLRGFVKIASNGSLLVADGIGQLAEQFKTENAALGERAGLNDEYASTIGPRGLAILQAEGKLRGINYDELTQEQKALAKSVGLRTNEEQAQAGFNARLEQGGFAADINKAKIADINILVGGDLYDSYLRTNGELTKYLDTTESIIKQSPGLASGLTGVAIGVGVLSGALVILGGPATLAFAGIAILVAALAVAWDKDIGGIRTQAGELGDDFSELFGVVTVDFELIQKVFGKTSGLFVSFAATLISQLLNVARFFVNFGLGIKDIFTGVNKMLAGDFIGGLKDIFGGIATIILSPFELGVNAAIDIINNMLRQYNIVNDLFNGQDVNEIKKLDVRQTIQSFESGGFPQGKNAIIQTNEKGQEYVANARATDGLATFFREVGQDFGSSDSSISDSYNSNFTQNNFGGRNDGGFTPPYGIS